MFAEVPFNSRQRTHNYRLVNVFTLLWVKEVSDVRAIIARLHHNIPCSEDGLVVVYQHCKLLLFGLGLMIRLPGIVYKHICQVLADMHCILGVGDCIHGKLIGGLFRVPLGTEEGVLHVLNGGDVLGTIPAPTQ